ncbi:class I SAM-dependent methyltransferase [Pseudomonas sp. CCI1.2]|uniref:class I SAM-dependent methyltransferase n=1 Tax=Pseudomonas sp. CCI1.2 TaxID=3048614 RepID=UPI002B2337F2|nr:class I SAM-dependent methyltransferase [Pseudomonas sp. CCI1.2]MEB0120481.1 class I SAM-dependent methyltransferase [Pseudomonas sp. CCI1.2]
MSSTELKRVLNQLAIDPAYISYPLSWLGHIPFAAWLIQTCKPKIFVELGSYSGTSYFSICQAVQAGGLDTKCFAIDTWEGDDHTGGYGEDVFNAFAAHNDKTYVGFSTYLRERFETANTSFRDASIDLLHIDGLHTYEAVKNDFETWLPKLSPQGVIIFHDTAVELEHFGVKRFWGEIEALYPSFNFTHSNGLGVLLVGSDYKDDTSLLESIEAVSELIQRLAERLWLQQIVREKEAAVKKLTALNDDLENKIVSVLEHAAADQQHMVSANKTIVEEHHLIEAEYSKNTSSLINENRMVTEELSKANADLLAIKSSQAWKVASKLRGLKKVLFG